MINLNGNKFEGRYNEQMPLLIQEGLQPYSTKDIMLKRIEVLQSNNQDEIDFWLNQYWDTSDGLAYFNGNIIIVPNSKSLININPNSGLTDGALPLTIDEYNGLSEKYGAIKRVDLIQGESLTNKGAKNHLILFKLAQGDQYLLDEYVDSISSAKTKEGHDYNKNRGIYLPEDQENPALRAWFLDSLYHWSTAYANNNLDYIFARLFGVRAENLDQILGNTAIKQG